MAGPILVTKGDGEQEPLDLNKLRRSLARSGAGEALVERVIERVTARVDSGIPTDTLYGIAFRQLRKERRHIAARYSLKRSVMQLGPTGYPFERLVGALLEGDGWQVRISARMTGSVTHEIDVAARREHLGEERQLLVECKHRSQADAKVDVKTALYVSARARDLLGDLKESPHQFWLATNGRFTQDAITYAASVRLGLLGWSYPDFRDGEEPPWATMERASLPPAPPAELDLPRRNLAQRITDALAFPITCLTSLKQRHKGQLLDQNVVLCRELEARPALIDALRLEHSQATELRRELYDLLHPMSLEPSPASRHY